jgi:Leucine-rich repeat (LRR) protein
LASAIGRLAELRGLDLSHNDLRIPGFLLVDGLAQCPKLEVLNLEGCRLPEEAVLRLAGMLEEGLFPNLRTLNLAGNSIRAPVTAPLLRAVLCRTAAQSLEALKLEGARLDAESLRAALPPTPLPRLKHLELTAALIGNEGGEVFANALEGGVLPALESLVLCRNIITDLGPICRALSSGRAPHLRVLDLGHDNPVGDDGAAAVAGLLQSNACPQLTTLSLVGIDMTDTGAGALADAAGAAALESGLAMSCERNRKISREGRKRLREAWAAKGHSVEVDEEPTLRFAYPDADEAFDLSDDDDDEEEEEEESQQS